MGRRASQSQGAARSRARARHQRDWAILLRTFEGKDAKRRAVKLLEQVRHEADVPDLWLKEQDDQAHLLRGRYMSRNSFAAMRDLQQTRMVKHGDHRPFESVGVVRISVMAKAGSLDVRQYRDEWLYTLQVGVFDKGSRETIRQTAERKAARLRADGHEAFYLHGPGRSMLTVGLFTDDDRVAVSTTLPSGKRVYQYVYGPRIKALQEHFPYNKVNGEKYYETLDDGARQPQSSSLIAIK